MLNSDEWANLNGLEVAELEESDILVI